MSMFIDPDKWIAVTHGPNTIWIRPQLTFYEKGELEESSIRLEMTPGRDESEGMKISTRVTASTQNAFLLEMCVQSWEGPAFEDEDGPIPCLPEYIRMLSPTEPLIQKVIREIDRYNQPQNIED